MANPLLTDFDWDEGMVMPVADATNKLLEDQVTQLQKESEDYLAEAAENDERIHNMSQHWKNVKQELSHNLALMDAVTNEVETEVHMSSIAQREEGRLQQEILRHEKELTLAREKRNNFENKIFTQSQQLDELRSRMNWDQETLEAWLEESARRDDDALTFEKYSNQDNSKLKELTLVIEHFTEEAFKRRKKLDQETTATLTAQIELDKTAEEFRKAHEDRQNLIAQWEITIDQMQRRDREMDHAATELSKVREEIRARQQVLKEKQAFLASETDVNKDMDRKIAAEERLAAKGHIDLQEEESTRSQLQDELDTLQYTVERTASDMEAVKSNIIVLKKEIVSKREKLHKCAAIHEELSQKLEKAKKGALSAEERAVLAGNVFSEEEEAVRNLKRELARIREIQFKKKQEMYEELTQEKNIASELQGSRAASRNLGSRLRKLDEQSIKQQEIIYNQDFSIQQLERRLARLQGDLNTEEKKQLEAKIADLLNTLDERNGIHTVLNTQLKRLQDDIRRQKRGMGSTSAMKADLTSKIEELNLHNEISEKELKNIISKKQKDMVEENILKLEIKKIQENLHQRADEVLTLEKRYLQLATAMKERKQEISVHKDMLSNQLQAAVEERSTVNAEVHQRTEKIEKLRKRYEILTIAMAPPEGEEDRSQAYYVIRAAQEKEDLQRNGDELDARIRKAEKEIRALENTLRLMNSRNETYRQSLGKVTDTSEDYALKSQLEDQLRSVMEKCKYKRRQIRELQEDLQTISSVMDSTLREEAALEDAIEDRTTKMIQQQTVLEEQKEKLERVQRQISRTARETRAALESKEPLLEERDMDVRELRSKNKAISRAIGEAAQEFPDLVGAMEECFQEAGLPVPEAVATSRINSKNSIRSSARSSPCSSVSSARSTSSIKAVDLGLGLQGTSKPELRPSSAGSRGSARSIPSQSSQS